LASLAPAGYATRNNTAVSSQSHWPDELFDELVHLQGRGDVPQRLLRFANVAAIIETIDTGLAMSDAEYLAAAAAEMGVESPAQKVEP